MKILKTKCDHCDKPLTPDKWEAVDYPIYCSQECTIAADKAMQEYFQKRMFK